LFLILRRDHAKVVARSHAETVETTHPVKVAKPLMNKESRIEVRQICLVEPTQKADLNTRIAGIVRIVNKDLGDRVKMGELMLELDSPDIHAEITAREQSVIVKQAELMSSESNLARVKAGIPSIQSRITQADAMVRQSEALLEYRARRLERYNSLARQDTVTGDLVDEQVREHKAAVAAVEASKAFAEQARGSLAEKMTEIESSKSDVVLKTANVDLARAEVAKAKAQLDLARLAAPFDGLVARRAVDSGDFVSAPSGVSRDPMLVVISDALRVVAHFPDTLSGRIRAGTPVKLRIDSVPGKSWAGTVTRVSPMVSTMDRTIRTEIDIHADGTRTVNGLFIPDSDRKRIVPGVSGELRVEVGDSTGAATIPSSSIISKGGQSVILLVTAGIVRVKPVQVVVNDGKSAIVRIREGIADKPTYRDLQIDDLVAISRQSKLADGDKVLPVEDSP